MLERVWNDHFKKYPQIKLGSAKSMLAFIFFPDGFPYSNPVCVCLCICFAQTVL